MEGVREGSRYLRSVRFDTAPVTATLHIALETVCVMILSSCSLSRKGDCLNCVKSFDWLINEVSISKKMVGDCLPRGGMFQWCCSPTGPWLLLTHTVLNVGELG